MWTQIHLTPEPISLTTQCYSVWSLLLTLESLRELVTYAETWGLSLAHKISLGGETWGLHFKKLLRWFWCILKCKKHFMSWSAEKAQFEVII